MNRATPLWVGVVLCAASMTAGAATVLIQDDFNSEATREGRKQLANFVASKGTVDVMAPGRLGIKDRGAYLDLDGSSGKAATLESRQAFTLEPGTYELTFDVSGSHRNITNPFNKMTVSLADVVNKTIRKKYNERFTTVTIPITVTSATSGKLRFAHAGGDDVGLLLDNVSLVQTSTPEATPPAVTPPVMTPPVTVPSTPTTGGDGAVAVPVPVPLPSAAGAGLATMAAVGVAGWARRRRTTVS